MSRTEIEILIIKALISWLLKDENKDGVPDKLEGLFGKSEREKANSDDS